MALVLHVNGKGGPEVLALADVTPPAPGPGEVRFAVRAFALNRADLLYMSNTHYTPLKIPSRLGSEAAGIVDAAGPGVANFKPGDRVSSVPFFTENSDRHGVQGSFAIVPAAYLAPWPEGFTAIEACSVWMQYLTAFYAMSTVGKLGAGKTVLIVAAASTAGIGAIQTARALGARIIATTRSPAKVAFLRLQGAAHVILTGDDAPFADQVMAATSGAGFDLAFDPVSGPFTARYIDAIAPGGNVLIYGALESLTISVPLLPLVRAGGWVHAYSMFNHVLNPDELAQGIAFVMDHIRSGAFRPVIDRVFPLADAIAAYRHMLGNTQMGKIVVTT
jgi:NADPH:quinone reductase-like Zn-dependent oxidoreductase